MENTETTESQEELNLPEEEIPQVADKAFFGDVVPNVYYMPNHGIAYLLNKKMFVDTHEDSSVTTIDVLRYIKGLYPKRGIFERDELDIVREHNRIYGDGILDEFIELLESYDQYEPFSFREAFEISNAAFKAKVFGTINISSMIAELGATRIKVEGKLVNRRKYDTVGNYLGDAENNVIYETYAVNGEKLGIENSLYVVKCWCTSTDKEHWLWIEPQYKDSPLEAIASTARFSATVIPHIKSMKRQGDIFLLEMDSDVTPLTDDIRPLTSEEYFKLLVAES
jgi:hypothetical protein